MRIRNHRLSFDKTFAELMAIFSGSLYLALPVAIIHPQLM
tara:strand:- start:133 stop:252 length:120 start_codon:yes stop_codon:yes gene_type:complete